MELALELGNSPKMKTHQTQRKGVEIIMEA